MSRHLDLPIIRLDPVTLLPNRQQFSEDYHPASGRESVMMTLADAQQFNHLLRALGHEYAEEFVYKSALRLRNVLPGHLAIYHVSVLSFVFTFPGLAEPTLLEEVTRQFGQPVICGGIPVATEIAIGIAEAEDPDPAKVLKAGLAAAQDSRRSGAAWARYDPQTDTAHRRGFLLLSHLGEAIAATDQLELHYQPKYALATGEPTGAEALLRWTHPRLGQISPADFVPLAEATTLIHGLTDWVTRHAIAEAGRWAARGVVRNMAINISPRNLARPGLARQIADLLAAHRVNPARIELEFTEGVLMKQDKAALGELQALRAMGIRIALDDFGTGFANFSYITHLPVDQIKLDKSFIGRADSDARAADVVRALIGLAHRLNYKICGEGIETEALYRLLAAWGCDEGQGYYMSRPLDAAALAALPGF